MFRLAIMGVLPLLVCASVSAQTRPELSVTLGESNQGSGLYVPSAGDGVNKPDLVGDVAVRRVAESSLFLYVKIDHPAYREGPLDLYVSAVVFDDTVMGLALEFDRAAERPDIRTWYTQTENAHFLTGLKQWRTLHFHLPAARMGRGQNHGTDFRLVAPGIAFREIRVSTVCPAGFDPAAGADIELLKRLAVQRANGMELTIGNDATATEAALFKALSVSSVESYVDWAGVEPLEGQWDWGQWDKQVDVLRGQGLKWVPFLIAGPAYATPLWFQNSSDSRVYRCLEHGRDSKVQSLFNPALKPQVERFLNAFAERYRDSGVIESLLLGITGIYGESIYPAGSEGGWTARLTGKYHNHFGWWAGDEDAVRAFRAAMRERYGRVRRLNVAWGTDFEAFEQVTTFLPNKAYNDRARADFVEWYQQAMTDWAVFWVKAARKAFPKTPVYLCTGGDGNPVLGADFTAQTAAIARYGAGVRITNEGSNYANNFSLTREVATATRHYGTFCGFEPASQVDVAGGVARIYNATASGARQLHDYKNNLFGRVRVAGKGSLENFRRNAAWLIPRSPRVRVAMYLSRETWALQTESVKRALSLVRVLRDASDLDLVTRRSLADGHLRDYSVLVLAESAVLEPESAKAIEKWVRKGGQLIAATRPDETLGGRLYDHSDWRARLFAEAEPGCSSRRKVGKGTTILLQVADSELSRIADLLEGGADGKLDGLYATETAEGVLWFDSKKALIWLENR
ncbi:MAG: beta-galactosidase [Kiritimatiellae bacterium]|nr:beta-galactosidase [Kiritimatiellia bacterium]